MEEVTFAEFAHAFRVFGGDYGIVGHPELEKRLPWDEPNPAGAYSLTQVPENMTEEEFLRGVEDMTDLVITCMDKDCAHSTWEQLQQTGKKVVMFSFGGGVVQDVIESGADRVSALYTIARYTGGLRRGGHLKKLETVHAADHDSVCGAVKLFLGKKPLHELLTEKLGRQITEHSPEENNMMAALVRDGAQNWIQAFAGTGVNVVAELHYTDREDPQNSTITHIDLGSGKPQLNISALKLIASLGN